MLTKPFTHTSSEIPMQNMTTAPAHRIQRQSPLAVASRGLPRPQKPLFGPGALAVALVAVSGMLTPMTADAAHIDDAFMAEGRIEIAGGDTPSALPLVMPVEMASIMLGGFKKRSSSAAARAERRAERRAASRAASEQAKDGTAQQAGPAEADTAQ